MNMLNGILDYRQRRVNLTDYEDRIVASRADSNLSLGQGQILLWNVSDTVDEDGHKIHKQRRSEDSAMSICMSSCNAVTVSRM